MPQQRVASFTLLRPDYGRLGSDRRTWNSVRMPGGGCVGAFLPDVVRDGITATCLRFLRSGERPIIALSNDSKAWKSSA